MSRRAAIVVLEGVGIGEAPNSGTAVIAEFGAEHQRTGKWIVYTSADSVFQVAAHEATVPLEELTPRAPRRATAPTTPRERTSWSGSAATSIGAGSTLPIL